jgi:diguanylate cyclase (GGDEF)-like protein
MEKGRVESSGSPPHSAEKSDRRWSLWLSLEPERIFHLAVVLLGLFLGGAAIHSYDSTRLVRNTLSLAQRYEREESLVSQYLLAMDDAETGQRGYLLTGDPAFLEPYTSGVRNSIALEQKIQHSLSGQMPPSKNIALLFQLAAAKRDELAQTIRLYRQGDRSAALDLVKVGRGKSLMDQIRKQIHKVQGQEKVDLLIARTALSRRLRYAERDLVVAGVALGLLTWLLWRLLSISMEKKRRSREFLEQETQIDRLTGLPNRKRLFVFLPEALCRAEEEGGSLAVLFVDLDGFKLVNDRHGHAAGDRILVEVARRFGSEIRSEDLLARLGGDEFVLCLTGEVSREGVESLAQRLIDSFEEPFFPPVGKGVLSCSVGVAFFPEDGRTPAELVAAADLAMYQSKNAGKRCIRFYSPGDRGGMSALPRSS